MPPRVLGLDIGGANVKAAHTARVAITRPFALWKDPTKLAAALSHLIAAMPAFDQLAITMTGELCDCFANRSQGVQAILDAVDAVAAPTPTHVWLNEGRFVAVPEARRVPLAVASANWLALATFAGRFAPQGPALLVDLGSTTTDIVPLVDGQPRPRGRSDLERMLSGELVYLGAARTPLAALVPFAVFRKRHFRLVPENFATMDDAQLLLGISAERPEDTNTPDGRPATKRYALARIARHFGADPDMILLGEVEDLCRQARETEIGFISDAIASVGFRLASVSIPVIRVGSGELLVRAALQRLEWTSPAISLAEQLGPELSAAAPAYAVAVLAAEPEG